MIKVGLLGGSGRVGSRVVSLLQNHSTLKLTAIFVKDLIDFEEKIIF